MSQQISYETIQCRVSELCVLSKFLGFVEFLPYRSPSSFSTSALSTMSAIRSSCHLSCNVVKLLDDAERDGCLMLVVQWLVQYLSQIDVVTLQSEMGKAAVGKLFAVYKYLSCKFNVVSV
jgi:codanin-1